MPVGRDGGGHGMAWHGGQKICFFLQLRPVLSTPPPLPTGILYCPHFCLHQETKMAARQTQLSATTISRKNGGL